MEQQRPGSLTALSQVKPRFPYKLEALGNLSIPEFIYEFIGLVNSYLRWRGLDHMNLYPLDTYKFISKMIT